MVTPSGPHATPSQAALIARGLQERGYSVAFSPTASTGMGRLVQTILTGPAQAWKADVIIVNVFGSRAFSYEALALILARVLRRPSIAILRGGWLGAFLDRWPLARTVLRLANRRVVPHGYLHDEMTERRVQIEAVIPNSIDLSRYRFRRRARFGPRVLYTRGMSWIYRPEMAIRVFSKIQAKYPDAVLTMAGRAGPHTAPCVELVRELGLRNVEILGMVPKEQISNLADRHDIYLQTNSVENMPVSVLEMWACGLPVVSTNVGGIGYLVTNQYNGLLAERDDEDVLARLCFQLIERPSDGIRLVENGYQTVQEYDYARVSARWLDMVREVTVGGSRNPGVTRVSSR